MLQPEAPLKQEGPERQRRREEKALLHPAVRLRRKMELPLKPEAPLLYRRQTRRTETKRRPVGSRRFRMTSELQAQMIHTKEDVFK